MTNIRDISSGILIAANQLTRPLILLYCQTISRTKCVYNWSRIEWLTICALIFVKLHVQSSRYYYALLSRKLYVISVR